MAEGLYGKYIIKKTDGSPIDLEAFYFILRPDKDPAAAVALRAYADALKSGDPLKTDIEAKLCSLETTRETPEMRAFLLITRVEEMIEAAQTPTCYGRSVTNGQLIEWRNMLHQAREFIYKDGFETAETIKGDKQK